MARQALLPGGGYLNETGNRQALIPGDFYLNETIASSSVKTIGFCGFGLGGITGTARTGTVGMSSCG